MRLRMTFSLITLLLITGCASSPEPTEPAGVLMFGASGGTGVATVERLREQGIAVTAFVRPTSNRESLAALGASFVVGDALSAQDVNRAVASGNYRAIISAIGGRPDQPRPDFIGVRNMVDAALNHGVSRMVLVSSIGAGDASRADPGPDASFFQAVLHEKTLGEDYLVASGLTYTILRPGGLRSEPATGNGRLTIDPAMGMIHRSDVGALVAQVLDDPATFDRIYHAVDPNLKRERRER